MCREKNLSIQVLTINGDESKCAETCKRLTTSAGGMGSSGETLRETTQDGQQIMN